MKDIEFSGLDFGKPAEIERIARIHQSAPLEWLPEYEVTEEAVEKTKSLLAGSKDNPRTHMIVVRAADATLVGFHWISIVGDHDEITARIESLWVDEKQRRRGVASELKRRGETWMRARGAKRVSTAVFYVNKTMIDLNIKMGFTPGQLHMTKELD